jgi:hypothetical protein
MAAKPETKIPQKGIKKAPAGRGFFYAFFSPSSGIVRFIFDFSLNIGMHSC